jgi:uncharacterized membrane protein
MTEAWLTTVETWTLWVHIAAGFAALFAGIGALATEKGGRRHRRFGRGYVYSMAVVSGTAIALYAIEPGFWRLFLGLVAVFSFYFAFSGYRVLSRKRPGDRPGTVDWGAVGVFGVASLGIVGMGLRMYLDGGSFAPVLLVFGGIGTAMGVGDLRGFRRDAERGEWIGQHVRRMGAGYIATVSAFSAVNFMFLPPVARWLWPTVLGTPLLIYFGRTYEAKFTAG